MQRPIKYQTFYGGKMHFWGFTTRQDGSIEFVPPIDLNAPQRQFTGLHDKNNKEIWEGDVVEVWRGDQTDPRNDHPWKCRVVWRHGGLVIENGLFSLALTDAHVEGSQLIRWMWSEAGHNMVPTTWHQAHSVAVIGNIYENPDRLK